MSMLENGIESQGAVSKSFDKYGKRMYVATPTKDMSKKDAMLSSPSEGKTSPMGYDSNTTRTRSC